MRSATRAKPAHRNGDVRGTPGAPRVLHRSARARRAVLLVCAAIGLAFPALPSDVAFADDAALARAIAASEAEAKAAWELRLPELVEAIEKDPRSPYAATALSRLAALADECRGAELVEQRLDPVLARGVGDGEIDESLRDILSDRARARGEWDRAKAYEQSRGYLREFAAVGPLGWSDAALVHRTFGPEDPVLDPKQSWEGAARRVGWVRLPSNPDSAWADPWSRLRDGGSGVWYAVARVRSAGTRPVALKVYCSDSFKVLVNGREVVVADRERDVVPWCVWADATLVDGWNRILVKVTGRQSFAIKLCDPATGLPLEGVDEGDPMEGGACPPAGAAPIPRAYRSPVERAIEECAGDGVTDPALLAVAADLAERDWRRWDAYRLYEKSAAALGDGATGALAGNVRTYRGKFLADFQPFPPVQRKLRAKKELEAALAAFPGHVGSGVRLAEYENEDDHPDRAVKALRALVAKHPSVNGWMSLARIAKARGWDAEAVDAAKKAAEVAPHALYVHDFLNDTDRRLGDFDAVGARLRRMLEVDRAHRGAAQGLVNQLRAQAKHAEALASLEDLAKRWPHELGWQRQIADALAATGRDDDALAAWTALEPKLPQDESLPRRVGEVLEVRGDRAGALSAYRRSLAIEPFQPQLWRAVTRIEGKDEDFAAGWEPNVEALIASLPPTDELKKKHPKAVAVTVLDHTVTRVQPDGSARSYVHMVYKVLDEKGVEKYESLPNQGETLMVRAILPDGTVTTPTGLGGQPYNIEGLVPGTILDHRFVVSERGGPKGYDGTKFYFQDFELQQHPNPVTLSRFVVITPAGMNLDVRKRNYDGDPRVETADGWTSTVWEKRDMPIVEPERFMPPNDEIFPHVDYERPAPFEDAPWQFLAQRSDSRGSPFVDEAVAACVKPGMSDLEKLRAIHEFVNSEIKGDQSSGPGATAVLLEKSGSRELLFESMARSAGVPFRLGRALPWNGSGRKLAEQGAGAFSGSFLWFEPRGAEPFPFFMLSRHTPFGLVPEPYRGSAAFVVDETGGRIVRLAAGGIDTDDSSDFTIRLGADENSATVAGVVRFRSPNGYGFKQRLTEMSEDNRRKFAEGQMSGWFANPKLTKYEIPRLAERGVPLDVQLEGTMSTYVVAQGDRYVVALGLQETGMTGRYVDKAERQFDLVINSRDDQLDEFTIDLGAAWEVSSLPQDHVAAHDVGVYSLTWRHEGRLVRVRREFHFHPARYRPDEYKQFVAWCKAIDDAEDRKLELRKVQ